MSTDAEPEAVLEDAPESIEIEVSIEEALGGHDPEDLNLEEEELESWIGFEADLQTRSRLREIARELIDDSEIPEARSLLWIDRAEVYTLCGGCYHANREGAWTGSTSNPDYEQLREHMHRKLEDGTPCAFCRSDRLDEIVDRLEDEIEISVEVDR